jgi:GNAT superfamily N-acetyltransferase
VSLVFSFAKDSDSEKIASLVNSAYRGDSSKQGWTTEADILDGQRTDAAEIALRIQAQHSYIVMAHQDGNLVGSCELIVNKAAEELYFGMFTIKPNFQNSGLGKLFLAHIEKLAADWKLKRITMTVITLRSELIAFYERRGYQVTNHYIPFPTEDRFGIPKVKDLKMVYLIKDLL